jgi:hypothetical protein
MDRNTTQDIPRQESREKWFKSHLLGREVELKELSSKRVRSSDG